MKQRGRKSAGDLSAVTNIPERPKPPRDLTKAQAKIWNRVVKAMPVEWFGEETHDLLTQYCRHVVDADKVAKRIDDLPDDVVVTTLNKLLKMQERESRGLSSLATRMRISQQSTLDREKRKTSTPAEKPWTTL